MSVDKPASDRVLALSLRPRRLRDLIGQQTLTSTLSQQLQTGRIPHFFIICGSVGAGKTTLARILSIYLQVKGREVDLTDAEWQNYRKYDIQEINAANHNGVDDMRAIIESMRFRPLPPSKAKVVILDEAHQLTLPAQNALITETEDVGQHVFYIFCTSAINKIIPALKRRAYIITPRPLDKADITELVKSAKQAVDENNLDTTELTDALQENAIDSPGLILQATERFFSGIPAEEAVLFTEASRIEPMTVCRSLAAGDWGKCSLHLKDATKADVYPLKSSVLGYLKAILLKSHGAKAAVIAETMVQITDSRPEDNLCLPSFLACICLACQKMSTLSKSKPASKPVGNGVKV